MSPPDETFRCPAEKPAAGEGDGRTLSGAVQNLTEVQPRALVRRTLILSNLRSVCVPGQEGDVG